MNQYNIGDDDVRDRTRYKVVFVSGLEGIGKTLFGKQALPQLIQKSDDNLSFKCLLSKSNYIHIEMNGGGDSFCNLDLTTKLPFLRLNLRILARASKISYMQLQELVEGSNSIIPQDDLLQKMRKEKNLIEVSNILEEYFKTGGIPFNHRGNCKRS